ncbi:histidine kinase [Streptomyces chrestomyceticus JCM 4735]|uniref:Histidine kinase n=1 Tax=Streptomyces chrestomyceticus JCM 4735 TaxID=1306181 RepID=A0A7U9PYU4_9ACTN|nr:ATP-binding protein [Streptomyces chrestomyceticus]GCD35665.1 histidine kinase [Streptomyces chrestomyceticus JCM 4735]
MQMLSPLQRVLRAEYLLPPAARSASWARRLTGLYLDRPGSACYLVDTDAAQLVVTELVSNATRHARSDCRLRLCGGGGFLSIEVHDDDPAHPQARPATADDEGGRGLFLVDALSTDLTVLDDPGGGKTVRATLAAA